MPELKRSTIDALAPLARPFETLDECILRLAGVSPGRNASAEGPPTNGYAKADDIGAHTAGVRNFTHNSTPNMRHTKLVKAVLGEEELPNPKWNDLFRHVHEVAFESAGRSFDKLRTITMANIAKGRKNDEGYSPVGNLGFSIQGVSANEALRVTLGIARKLNVPLEVVFDWRDKEGAEFPGQTGRIVWNP